MKNENQKPIKRRNIYFERFRMIWEQSGNRSTIKVQMDVQHKDLTFWIEMKNECEDETNQRGNRKAFLKNFKCQPNNSCMARDKSPLVASRTCLAVTWSVNPISASWANWAAQQSSALVGVSVTVGVSWLNGRKLDAAEASAWDNASDVIRLPLDGPCVLAWQV